MGAEGRVVEAEANGFAGRVEVMEGPSGRRTWPDEVKARIVRESLEPGATVSEVARRHRISPQQLTQWRRAAREHRIGPGWPRSSPPASLMASNRSPI